MKNGGEGEGWNFLLEKGLPYYIEAFLEIAHDAA